MSVIITSVEHRRGEDFSNDEKVDISMIWGRRQGQMDGSEAISLRWRAMALEGLEGQTSCASGLEGPESAHCVAIARQYYEAVEWGYLN